MASIIAMIPARMGSKRIPKKNIRLLCGKPLLQYAIENAKAAACFNEIWVNSESDTLGQLAKDNGVNFHKRPEELSIDTATNQEFTTEFLKVHDCDYVVMVNTTSPLLQPVTISLFCKYIEKSDFDTVLSVIDEKAESFFDNRPINFTTGVKVNSQDLKPIQKVVWALTAWRRDHFLAVADRGECSVFSGRLGLFDIPSIESCDIDTQEDWDLAASLMKTKGDRVKQEKESVKYWGEKVDER